MAADTGMIHVYNLWQRIQVWYMYITCGRGYRYGGVQAYSVFYIPECKGS